MGPRRTFVSQPSDVPEVVLGMLEQNGNALVETRPGKTPTGEPCTEYFFRDPLVLTAAQHRAVKRHLTRCNPDQQVDGFSQLENGRHGDRFAWIDSGDEQHRRRLEEEGARASREREEAAAAAVARAFAGMRDGEVPPRPPTLTVSDSAATRALHDCGALDAHLGSLGVGFLVVRQQPDDVLFRLLDRDVLLPPDLFARLSEAPHGQSPGKALSVTRLERAWDSYAIADDLAFAEWHLDRKAQRSS